jgi:alpha-beta hydrolase superfamily lysophospholipase
VPLVGSRTGVERLSNGATTERIFPGARHEVFHETNRAEAFAEVKAFVDRVLGG